MSLAGLRENDQTLCQHSPELASFACFQGKGRIDFTYGMGDNLANDVFSQ
jgi:hypothetical protein